MQRLNSQKPIFLKIYTEYLSEDSDYEYNSEEDDWNYEVKLEQPSPTKSLHWDTRTQNDETLTTDKGRDQTFIDEKTTHLISGEDATSDSVNRCRIEEG